MLYKVIRMSIYDHRNPNSENKISSSLGQTPSSDEIKMIVEIAQRATSADNAQPWKFEYKKPELHVHHDESRARHDLNHNQHVSLISLGTTIELIRVAAESLGYRSEIQLSQNFKASQSWAVVRFTSFASVVDGRSEGKSKLPLQAYLQRQSNRYPHKGGQLPEDLISQSQQLIADQQNVSMSVLSTIDSELLELLAEAEGTLWNRTKSLKDITSWMRFSQKQYERSRDGLHFRELGADWFQFFPLLLIKKFPSLARWLWNFGFGMNVKMHLKKCIRSSGNLILFSVKNTSAESLVQVGVSALRVWSFLQSQGWGLQAHSASSLGAYDFKTGVLPDDLTSKQRLLFENSLKMLSDKFNVKDNHIPVWLFRSGKRGKAPVFLSLRQTADQVLSYK